MGNLNKAEGESLKAEEIITWRSLAKDLAESGSAIVLEVRAGRTPCPLVLSLFLEACTTYDRMTEAEGLESKVEGRDELPICTCAGSLHLDCVGVEGGKACVTTVQP